MKLSIVVIGKNEEKNLQQLFLSLQSISFRHEIIYVDSASSDHSASIALKYAHVVCKLEQSSQLCASAGRYIGTLKANGEWILYLDGDMTLSPEFADWINVNFKNMYESSFAGYIGKYTYLYEDGKESKNQLLHPKKGRITHFGGAVLLNKSDVINAGNWNPSVVANEEIDLYTRIQKNGKHVEALDIEMVRHLASGQSRAEILRSLFFPINNRFFGFGQALKSQCLHHTLLAFIYYHPFPFLFWGLLIVSLFYSLGWFVFLAFVVYISLIKKPHYLIIYFTDLIRGVFGFMSYKKYEPRAKCQVASDILQELKK